MKCPKVRFSSWCSDWNLRGLMASPLLDWRGDGWRWRCAYVGIGLKRKQRRRWRPLPASSPPSLSSDGPRNRLRSALDPTSLKHPISPLPLAILTFTLSLSPLVSSTLLSSCTVSPNALHSVEWVFVGGAPIPCRRVLCRSLPLPRPLFEAFRFLIQVFELGQGAEWVASIPLDIREDSSEMQAGHSAPWSLREADLILVRVRFRLCPCLIARRHLFL